MRCLLNRTFDLSCFYIPNIPEQVVLPILCVCVCVCVQLQGKHSGFVGK